MRISDIPDTVDHVDNANTETWQTLSSVCDRLIKRMEELLKEDAGT